LSRNNQAKSTESQLEAPGCMKLSAKIQNVPLSKFSKYNPHLESLKYPMYVLSKYILGLFANMATHKTQRNIVRLLLSWIIRLCEYTNPLGNLNK